MFDGNSFKESPEISYHHYLANAVTGITIRYDFFKVTLSGHAHTLPFENPEGDEYQMFGRITFDIIF